jgi:hypothetical protein
VGLAYTSTDPHHFDPFPAKTLVRFEHGLGIRPREFHAYLAFTKEGDNGAGPGSFAHPAGNEVLYDCVDSDVIVVKNDTCESSFFIYLTADALADGVTDDHSCSQ